MLRKKFIQRRFGIQTDSEVSEPQVIKEIEVEQSMLLNILELLNQMKAGQMDAYEKLTNLKETQTYVFKEIEEIKRALDDERNDMHTSLVHVSNELSIIRLSIAKTVRWAKRLCFMGAAGLISYLALKWFWHF
jgi:hypothetical protein